MKNVKNWLSYIIFNLIFILCLVLGGFNYVEGAMNIATFMVWMCFIISLFSVNKDVKKAMKKVPLSMPRSLDFIIDLIVVFLLVWNSYWVLVIIYIIHMLLMYEVNTSRTQKGGSTNDTL